MTANYIKMKIDEQLTKSGEEATDDFIYGDFQDAPNKKGVFQIKQKWFIYETDEKNIKSITGPFKDEDIIYACVKLMHKSKYFKEYRFSKEAKTIYIHVHFRSIKEAGL